MKQNLKHSVFVALAGLALAACTENSRESARQGAVLEFQPSIVNATDWNLTRATEVQQLDEKVFLHTEMSVMQNNVTRSGLFTGSVFGEDDVFYVSGYRYDKSGTVDDVNEANFFFDFDAPVTCHNDRWRTSCQFYVPYKNDCTDFFAWFTPSGTDGVTSVNASGGLQVEYDMPKDLTKQPDLLVAACRSQDYSSEADHSVSLPFSHALTCVNFVMDKNVAPGTIQEIAFLNVCTKATLKVGGSWNWRNGLQTSELAYGLDDFSTVDESGRLKTGTAGQILTGLMMIPQEFRDASQKIRITMTVDGITKELYANLSNGDEEHPNQWQAGKTVTYTISTSDVNYLRIGDIGLAETADDAPHAEWAEGDRIGLFVVRGIDDEGHVDGQTLRYSNVPLVYKDNQWTISKVDGLPVMKHIGDSYYIYYPYTDSEEGTALLPTSCSEAGGSAETFFATLIANRNRENNTSYKNQSDDDSFTRADLQVAKLASADDEGSNLAASTIAGTLKRQVGLAVVSLNPKTIPVTVTYTNNATTYTESEERYDVTASNAFVGNLPYHYGEKYFFFTQAGVKTTFSSEQGLENSWESALDFTLGKGESQLQTASNSNVKKNWPYLNLCYEYTYTGKVPAFRAPYAGSWKFELWGAEGNSKKGNYISGMRSVSKNERLYVSVGGSAFNTNGMTYVNSDYTTKTYNYTSKLGHHHESGCTWYGPYWITSDTGIFQVEINGSTGMNGYTGIRSYQNSPHIDYAVSNISATATSVSATVNVHSQPSGSGWEIYINYPSHRDMTSGVIYEKNQRLMSAGGFGTTNNTSGLTNVSSENGVRSGNGLARLTLAMPF